MSRVRYLCISKLPAGRPPAVVRPVCARCGYGPLYRGRRRCPACMLRTAAGGAK